MLGFELNQAGAAAADRDCLGGMDSSLSKCLFCDCFGCCFACVFDADGGFRQPFRCT